MDFKRIITDLLGLQDVNIEDIKFFKKKLHLEVVIRQIPDRCKCSRCGGDLYGVHQWEMKELKAPPMGHAQTVKIKFYQLRAACNNCLAIRISRAPFIHPKFRSMTCGFAEVAGRWMEETTCAAVGRRLGCDDKVLWHLDQWRMNYMLQFMRLPEDLDTTLLSADEVHSKTKRFRDRRNNKKRWEAKFVTNLVCYTEAKVLFNALGRGSGSLEDCLQILSTGQKLAVEYFAVDMHEPFMKVITNECPNAEICLDRFHLVQQINKCFDQTRKTEIKKAEENNDNFQMGMLAPSKRFIFTEREKSLTKQEQRWLDRLRNLNKNIHTGMLIVEYFHRILDQRSIKSFRKALGNWYTLIRESGLKSFKSFAVKIAKYRKQVEAYIKSHLTTAVSEGLNNKIKVLKRVGYTYTNPQSFRLKILQRCGFLNSNYIDTRHFFWHVEIACN
jgi:transposase